MGMEQQGTGRKEARIALAVPSLKAVGLHRNI